MLYDNDNPRNEKHISLAVYAKLTSLRPRPSIIELKCTLTCTEFDSASFLAIV